jgi:hypothetical protein
MQLSLQALERNALVRLISDKGLGLSVLIGLVFWNLSGQTVAIGAMVMLWAFWRFLPIDEGPPGLPFSCSFHLTQIVIGVFYVGVTGRSLQPMLAPQFDRMMWLAMLSIGATALGFVAANHWVKGGVEAPPRLRLDLSIKQMVVAYIVVVLAYDTVFRFAYQIPLFTQAVLALLGVQGGLLYLVLRRLFFEGRPYLAVVIVLVEVARGFTGFYSDFKQPVLLALLASAEVFRPRKVGHWLLVAALLITAVMLGTVWLGIRGEIREDISGGAVRPRAERLTFAVDLARSWWQSDTDVKMYDLDDLVERMWDIYYTALALDRVPSQIPHGNGETMWAAVQHVLTPRFLFPNKEDLPSESEDVYHYTGLRVAGREQATTIAFGSVIQSYIDFGVPLMFVPPLLLGVLLGALYRWLLNTVHHEEILLAIMAVAFWSTLMSYNVSWAKILGKFVTAMIYMAGPGVLLDKMLYERKVQRAAELIPLDRPVHPRRL